MSIALFSDDALLPLDFHVACWCFNSITIYLLTLDGNCFVGALVLFAHSFSALD